MRGAIRWLMVLAPVAVVLWFGELHARLIGHYHFTGSSRFGWTIAFVVLLELGAYATGLPDAPATTTSAFWTAVGAVGAPALVISLSELLLATTVLPRAVVAGSSLVLVPVYTAVAVLQRRSRRTGVDTERVLAVVSPTDMEALRADLDSRPERFAQLVALLLPGEATPTVDGPAPLVEATRQTGASVVVLGREAQSDEGVVAQAALLHGGGTRVRTLSLFYDEWLGKLPVAELERISLMFDIQELHSLRYARLKRLVDLLAGLAGLIPLAVVTPVVWLLDRCGNPGALVFRQARVGKGGREFTIVKFRTMPDGVAAAGWTSTRDERLGTVGRWLRRSHLDELPQVLNLLRGELSLVGPRPEQPRYVAELVEKIPFYDVRHLVNPGMTGWAQVKFPYGSSVEDALEKLQYEFYYLRHQGPVLDARILARTLRSVLRLEGR
jgi:lipopolysaccharide/colanic/teichoic acid biosynthesis glycosyltransferase